MSTAGTIYEAISDKGRNAGLLRHVSGTALSYLPYNGNRLKINGTWQTIPVGGIAGMNATGTSCFVNGVAGQWLAANTHYYVYAFMNGATLTADFSATGHSTSMTTGNVGVEIKTGDDTRSLIGMIFTNASGQLFNQESTRWVRTWFNRQAESLVFANNFTAQRSTVAGTLSEVNTEIRCNFLKWDTETVTASIDGQIFCNAESWAGYFRLTFDTLAHGYSGFAAEAGQWYCACYRDHYQNLAENATHYATISASVQPGSTLFLGSGTAANGFSRISGMIQ